MYHTVNSLALQQINVYKREGISERKSKLLKAILACSRQCKRKLLKKNILSTDYLPVVTKVKRHPLLYMIT